MTITIDKRLFIYLGIGFIVATIAGVLSHELGHYLVAKYLGYNAKINYDSTALYTANGPEKVMFASDSFWITWGGPFQTMLTGTAGFILLFIFCQSYYSTERLEFRHWILIFLALFWLRQVANLFLWIGNYPFTGKLFRQIDEIRLAKNLQLPDWFIITFSGVIGIAVLFIVIFRFIPLAQRFTFIIAGLAGSAAGYFLWFKLLGPHLLPA